MLMYYTVSIRRFPQYLLLRRKLESWNQRMASSPSLISNIKRWRFCFHVLKLYEWLLHKYHKNKRVSLTVCSITGIFSKAPLESSWRFFPKRKFPTYSFLWCYLIVSRFELGFEENTFKIVAISKKISVNMSFSQKMDVKTSRIMHNMCYASDENIIIMILFCYIS